MKKATQKTMNRILNTLLAGMLLLTFGCLPGSNVNLTQGSKSSIPGLSLGVQSQKVSTSKHVSRNAQPYTGPDRVEVRYCPLGR